MEEEGRGGKAGRQGDVHIAMFWPPPPPPPHPVSNEAGRGVMGDVESLPHTAAAFVKPNYPKNTSHTVYMRSGCLTKTQNTCPLAEIPTRRKAFVRLPSAKQLSSFHLSTG